MRDGESRDPLLRWSRRFLVLGAVFLVASPVAAVLLGYLGSTNGLLEKPAALRVQTGSSPSQLAGSWSGDASGLVFVPPLQSFLLALRTSGPGSLVRIPASDFSSTAMNRVCPGALYPLYYPGSGTTVYGQCAEGNTTAILFLNSSNMQAFGNVSLGAEPFAVSLAFDEAHQWLYCSRPDGYLWTIDVAHRVALTNVSLPWGGGLGAAPIWFETSGGRLLIDDLSDGTLRVVDPATGTLGASVALPGPWSTVVVDSALGRLYVPYDGLPGAGNGIAVLDALTLSTVALVPLGPLVVGDLIVDRTRGEVDIPTDAEVYLLNESRDQILDSAISFGGLPTRVGTAYLALDTSHDAYGAVATYSQSVGLALYPAVRTYSENPPWSAVPFVGEQLPLYVAIVGVLVAIPLLGQGWRWRFGSEYLELPPSP